MIYNWFYIFNASEFGLAGLVSRTYTVVLEGIGQKDVLVTQGNYLGITYEGVYLPINFNSENPFKFEDIEQLQTDDGDSLGVEIDSDNNVWLGILVRS